MMLGNTKKEACTKMLAAYPVFDRPKRRIIPLSNVFSSTVIISSEYISSTDTAISKRITTLNTSPRSIIANDRSFTYDSKNISESMG